MNKIDIPVVILCGGRGARFDQESQVLPKPLIVVAGKPILRHIIDSLVAQGFWRFILATGYKGDEIVRHFDEDSEFLCFGPQFKGVSFVKGEPYTDVLIVDTENDSHTGKRLELLAPYLDSRFILTYGDGLSDVNMERVLVQHDWAHQIKSDSFYGDAHPAAPLVTITAVHPPGRFGIVKMGNYPTLSNDMNVVTTFDEKPSDSLINGGFMVVEPEFIIKYLANVMGAFQLESEALPALAQDGKMQAYVHTGYWKCMDTRRDLEQIEADVKANCGKLPWMREIR